MKITNFENGNRIIEGENCSYDKASINFNKTGRGGNILFLEGNLNLRDSIINFDGENSIVFLRSTPRRFSVTLFIANNSAFYIGKNVFAASCIYARAAERKHVFLGDDLMFSSGVNIKTIDGHLIYSTETMKRKNYSKSVFIGDHVWIGQYVMLLKGTQIASGSIIGAKGLVAGKKISSNTIWAGNPAKLVSKDKFWHRLSVDGFTEEDSKNYDTYSSDEFIYKYDPKVYISFDEIDRQLTLCKTADEKMEYLLKISDKNAHNRFAF